MNDNETDVDRGEEVVEITAKQEPIKKFSAFTGSRIEVAVWKFRNGKRVNYAVTCNRSFKKGEGRDAAYEDSAFFQERDMLTLSALLQKAWAWINDEQGR